MSILGIYFGPKLIDMVEVRGKEVLNKIQIPESLFSTADLEDKLPDELKIVALFKEELRKNKIEAKEATLALSGKDLIIRNFDMPILPSEELANAINFEAKKYIPFKIEDLISDFQVQVDRPSRRNIVLFVGIKKETLSKYLSILSQVNIKVSAIEYSGFSILKLLKLSGANEKGVHGVINADFEQEQEVDFTILENGFPLFSRGISLSGLVPEQPEAEKPEANSLLEKFKTETRISLDYYHRKFPAKKISQIFIAGSTAYQADLETAIQELDLSFQFIDLQKIFGKGATFSLSFLKAYSSGLSRTIKSSLKIDLLANWEKSKIAKEREVFPKPTLSGLTGGLKVSPHSLIIAGLICLAGFGIGWYQKSPLENDLKKVIAQRPQSPQVNAKASLEELQEIERKDREKIVRFEAVVKKQLYLTPVLSAIARLRPEGMWIESVQFNKQEDRAELNLRGGVLDENHQEVEIANKFLNALKKDPTFSRYFNEINIVSLDSREFEGTKATNFEISARTASKERGEYGRRFEY